MRALHSRVVAIIVDCLAIGGCCIVFLAAAGAESQLAAASPSEAPYEWHLPPGFPPPVIPVDNPMSQSKVALGCRLFFDTRLSSNSTYACSSCHRPELGFTDGRARALGATGETVRRGAMGLTNVAYNTAYTWASDKVVSLEAQMEQPLFNEHPLEMGLARDGKEWLATLADERYASDFRQAFPGDTTPVSAGNMIKAIAAFERTLISGRSAFDRYVFDDDRTALSPEAQRGMALFFSQRASCVNCHSGVNFSGPIPKTGRIVKPLFANTAVAESNRPSADPLRDVGLSEVTHRVQDTGKFRVPTLRNVALTAPYMHDGSIATLEAVVDHYGKGGERAKRGRNTAIKPLSLGAQEKQELVAFLNSLTDEAFIARYSALAEECK